MGEQLKWFVICLGTIVIGVLLWKVLPSSAANTTVHWKFGNQVLDLNVKKDMSDPEPFIKKLMSKPFSRRGSLAILNKYGIYSIKRISVVHALQALCPDEKTPNESRNHRQQRLQACAQIPVIKSLRTLAGQHAAPFQYISQEVTIGTPATTQPQVGHANICVSRDGEFFGHDLEIDTLQGQRSINVVATGYYKCTDWDGAPDIQLSAQDALNLFRRPTRKIEKAIAVPM